MNDLEIVVGTPTVEIYAGQERSWGSFQDSTNQTAASTAVAYPVTFDTTDLSSHVSVIDSSKITFANAGIYNIQFSVQCQNTDTKAQEITLWLRKNGTDLTGSAGVVSVPSSHGGVAGLTIAGWNYFVRIDVNDYVQLCWHTSSTLTSLITYPVGTTPVHPSAASAILTANMV